ncbi:MAG: hypothetical protein R3C10_27725 [Pirellulales bacterium]
MHDPLQCQMAGPATVGPDGDPHEQAVAYHFPVLGNDYVLNKVVAGIYRESGAGVVHLELRTSPTEYTIGDLLTHA